MILLYRDILIGLMFIFGITGFISGQFIISSILFAIAAILSNSHLHIENKNNSWLFFICYSYCFKRCSPQAWNLYSHYFIDV